MATEDDLNVLRTQTGGMRAERNSGEGFTRKLEEKVRIGRSGARSTRAKLFNYDRMQGLRSAQLKAEVGQADRMSDGAAAVMLERIHEHFKVQDCTEGELYDFDHAMFLCYAMNGGSQLAPHDRISFSVVMRNGVSPFDFKGVHDVCGIDMRRFFRTMANPVVDACRHLYFKADLSDEDQFEMRERMIKLAASRNLSRFPFLVADCCDAATTINEVEFASVMASKAAVIGATTNAVDQMRSAVTIQSSDAYDSSLGKNVPVVKPSAQGPVYRN